LLIYKPYDEAPRCGRGNKYRRARSGVSPVRAFSCAVASASGSLAPGPPKPRPLLTPRAGFR